ncbi:MAG: glycosyltransferase family 4 protein [Chloroflexia bacterium]|nr:glycosyltransferase family 4 protein [Chloroflexia bacterium]
MVNIPDGFKIMYTGNIGEAQNFELIIDAAIRLKEHKNIKWVFVGSGRKIEYIKEKINEHNLENIYLPGNFSIIYMPYFFSKADVMLVSLKDELIFNITVPAKLQAYMGYGKPIIGLLKGEGANIIREANCGYVCSQSDSSELVNTVLDFEKTTETLRTKMSINAKEYYNQNFSKEKNFNTLEKFYFSNSG